MLMNQRYYLMIKKSGESPVSTDFEKLNIETKLYDIYRKRIIHNNMGWH